MTGMKDRQLMLIMLSKLQMEWEVAKNNRMILIHLWMKKLKMNMGIELQFSNKKINLLMIHLLQICSQGLIQLRREILWSIIVYQWVPQFMDKTRREDQAQPGSYHEFVKWNHLITLFKSILHTTRVKLVVQIIIDKFIKNNREGAGHSPFGLFSHLDGLLSDGS